MHTSVLQLLVEYVGRDLTTETAEEIADAPIEQISDLVSRVVPFYYDWLEKHEASLAETGADSTDQYYCVDSAVARAHWRHQVEYHKRFLLYSPRLVIPDPLAAVLKPTASVAALTGHMIVDEEFRQSLRNALLALAHLAPIELSTLR